jgi:hypothetical protein
MIPNAACNEKFMNETETPKHIYYNSPMHSVYNSSADKNHTDTYTF